MKKLMSKRIYLVLIMIVYKIVTKVNWNNFINSGLKECKGFDRDLIDGYIHLSTHEQLYHTFIRKYDINDKEKFNILAVDLNESEKVKWERAKNGIIYPHLYSPLIMHKNLLWVHCLASYHFDMDGI